MTAAVAACKQANDTAKGMKIRQSVLTRERDTALKELADIKREFDTRKAEHRESYAQPPVPVPVPVPATGGNVSPAMDEAMRQLEEERAQWQRQAEEVAVRLQAAGQEQQTIGTAIPGGGGSAAGGGVISAEVGTLKQQLQEAQNSIEALIAERDKLEVSDAEHSIAADFSPAKSRELRREIREQRLMADSRKQQLDTRVAELGKIEGEREALILDIGEKEDEIESLKTVSAEESRILNDQLQQKQREHKKKERDMEEAHTEALADAHYAKQTAIEDYDREKADHAEEKAKDKARLKAKHEALSTALAERNEPYDLTNELDKWLRLAAAVGDGGGGGSGGPGGGGSPVQSSILSRGSSMLSPASVVGDSGLSISGGWLTTPGTTFNAGDDASSRSSINYSPQSAAGADELEVDPLASDSTLGRYNSAAVRKRVDVDDERTPFRSQFNEEEEEEYEEDDGRDDFDTEADGTEVAALYELVRLRTTHARTHALS